VVDGGDALVALLDEVVVGVAGQLVGPLGGFDRAVGLGVPLGDALRPQGSRRAIQRGRGYGLQLILGNAKHGTA
jgi:hypothetical protein